MSMCVCVSLCVCVCVFACFTVAGGLLAGGRLLQDEETWIPSRAGSPSWQFIDLTLQFR